MFLGKGWELLGILLFFYLPTTIEVFNEVMKFSEANSDSILDTPELATSQYAKHCLKRLNISTTTTNSTTNLTTTTNKQQQKLTIEGIRQARYNIFHPSKFGTTLDELMELQSEKFSNLKIPWILNVLLIMIVESGGNTTEGKIFKINDSFNINDDFNKFATIF